MFTKSGGLDKIESASEGSSVIKDIENGFLLQPGNSNEKDYLTYQLPDGNKKVSIELKYRKRAFAV